MMSETVSVVIPAYNAARFLRETLQSVLAQTSAPLEVLVVDDGSTDDTARIAQSFGPPVRCLNQENQGLSRARNAGIRAARGDWIALLDADDLWLPRKLERQIERLRQHGIEQHDAARNDETRRDETRRDETAGQAVACFTLTEYVDRTGHVLRRSALPRFPDLVEALLLYSCIVGPPSAALLHRRTLEQIGLFDPRFSQCADWDMWLRLAEAGPVAYVAEPLVRYRVHETNMSHNIPLLEKDTFAVLDKFFAAHVQPRHTQPRHARYGRLKNHCYSNHWLIVAGSYLHAGRRRDSVRCLLRGLLCYPLNLTRPLGLPARWLQRRLLPKPRVS